MTSKHVWPEQKQLAVSITVLIETWTEGRAPPYSVQTTQLKPGTVDNSAITWAQYGGNEGVWPLDVELLNLLPRWSDDPVVIRKILSDNPARLYQF
jgi:hypothetical protein